MCIYGSGILAVPTTTSTGDSFVFQPVGVSLAASSGKFGFAVNKQTDGQPQKGYAYHYNGYH
jgi:hypothetical protein